MNRLVIAEKPSVGKAIAAVLGAHGREDGCFIGNGYIVSWCFGHLAELAAADTYDEKYGKWRCEDLPILPQPWRYSISEDKRRQFDLLREFMRSNEVSEVINASLVLVLPYLTAEYANNQDSFESYYDETEVCQAAAGGHFKSAIQTRNREMVDRSDLVICCIERDKGGAYQTMQYARRQGKEIINIGMGKGGRDRRIADSL